MRVPGGRFRSILVATIVLSVVAQFAILLHPVTRQHEQIPGRIERTADEGCNEDVGEASSQAGE